MIGRRITLAGIALIMLIVAADSYEAWQDYRVATSDDERAQRALGRALSEQAARMVQETDLVLSGFAAWLRSPEGIAADSAARGAHLDSSFKPLPFVRSATVAGADGQVLLTTRQDGAAGGSLAQRSAFIGSRNRDDNGLYIGRPYVAQSDGAVNIALSRGIVDGHGAFAGVVVANLAFDYLTGFYAGVDFTPDTLIRVARQDGVVLAQYPTTNATGEGGQELSQAWNSLAGEAEQVRRERDADGAMRIVTLRRVEGYPLVVEVSRDLKSVLRPWQQRELGSALRTLALALLAAALLVGLRTALDRRDRLERELENAKRADALGFLAASVAHDFNNVLSAIVGYAELTRNAVAPGSPARSNIERLLAATERARLLVRRVLTFNPRRSTNYQLVAVQPVVAEVMEQVRATLPRAIELKSSGTAMEPAIHGDATEVHQVIMNICSNAIHAMPQGGTLELRTDLLAIDAAQSLTVGTLQPGRWLRLSVSDTGAGIESAKLASIFEPFYTTRESGQGSGIGLAVVRNFVTRMGGAIDVRSGAGAGTTVSVYWPLPAQEAVTLHARPSDARRQGRGESILIVDDERELVSLVEELLASLGYEPVGFTDACAALDAFRREPDRFDLVLSDERMPSLRGIEFAEQVHAVRADIPIIMMTGHRDTELDVRAARAGIAEILDKPIRTTALQDAVERNLRAVVAPETAARGEAIVR